MDLALLQTINQLAGQYEWLDKLVIFFAQEALAVLIVLVVLLWFMDWGLPRRKNQYAVVLAFETLLLTRFVAMPLIHAVYARTRPFVEHDITVLIPVEPLAAAFPSGHATMAFALALSVLLYNKKAGVWLLISAIIISFARIYVGVHYPGDVVGSLILVLLTVLLLNAFKSATVAPVVAFLRGKKRKGRQF